MKSIFALAMALGLACSPGKVQADPVAAIGIEQALKVAQDYLRDHALTTSISSLALQQASLTSKEVFWYAAWSPAIQVDGKTEAGLRINMDGSIVRLTGGVGGGGLIGGSGGRPDQPGVRRFGVRNMH